MMECKKEEKSMKEYKYKAFISYRHLEPDMQAAERLQKLLESYKPPKNITDKKEKWRIFRDVSELQSSSDLSEAISNAIEDSEFLIVICSPAYTESKWCMKELMHFRELHGDTNENIITLLVSGEPDKAFPELLRYADMKTVDENGHESMVKVEVEPLAANITADSLKASMKKLNTEYLRIAAPLIGCDFNDLYQREKRREAQRKALVYGSAAAVLSVITIISTASAVTISKKNSEIKKKNDKINNQYAELVDKTNKLLVENAEHLAAESEVLYKNNEFVMAVKKAVEALPYADSDKPVIPEAEYVLSREMGAYDMETLIPRYELNHESAIEKLSYTNKGNSIVSQDNTGIYIWKAEDGSLIKKITSQDEEFASSKYGASNKLNSIICTDTDKSGTMFSYTGQPGSLAYDTSTVFDAIYPDYAHNVSDSEPGTDGKVFLYNSDGTVWRIDSSDGKVTWKRAMQDNAYEVIEIVCDGQNILRVYSDKQYLTDGSAIAGTGIYIDVIDAESGEIVSSSNLSEVTAGNINYKNTVEVKTAENNILYLFISDTLNSKVQEQIASYDLKDGKATLRKSVPIAKQSIVTINQVGIHMVDGSVITTVYDQADSDVKSYVTRYDEGLDKEVWKAELSAGIKQDDKVFLFRSDKTGCAENMLAIVGRKSISLINYDTGAVISNITLDKDNFAIDVSFSDHGLIMFATDTGNEYVVSVKSFTGSSPKKYAYHIQEFDAPFKCFSYSRGRYVTAAEYANTAYIQYTEKTAAFSPVTLGSDHRIVSVLACDNDGSNALVNAKVYPEGSKDGALVTYIYQDKTGEYAKLNDLQGYTVETAKTVAKDQVIALVCGKSYQYKMVRIDLKSKSVTEISGGCDAGKNIDRLRSDGNSVYNIIDHGKKIVKIDADGKVSEWDLDGRTSQAGMYDVSGTGVISVYVKDEKNNTETFEFYDFDNHTRVTAALDYKSLYGDEVRQVFGNAIALSSGRVMIFDQKEGKLLHDVKLSGLAHEPVAYAAYDGRYMVLCRDSKLYEFDGNGLTGKVLSLECSDDYNGKKISEADISNSNLLEVVSSSDKDCFYVVWNETQAWCVNKDKFKVRYHIGDFACAALDADKLYVCDSYDGKAGSFPLYTAKQLVDSARAYLKCLGEKMEEN